METKKEVGNATVKFLRKESDAQGVTFTLGNGQALRIELAEIPAHTQLDAMLHGISQKGGDSAAGCAADKAYGAAYEAIKTVLDNLRAGKWNATRESGGNADLVAALAKLKKADPAAVAEVVKRADAATVKAWLRNPKVDAEIKAIRLARAKEDAKNVSVDDIDLGL